MANVANFAVVRDVWTSTELEEGIDFEIPSTIDRGKRSLLTFMLRVHTDGVLRITLRINGKKVWTWVLEDYDGWGAYQEVVDDGVLHPGTNTVSFDFDADAGGAFDYTAIFFSDMVVWWRDLV